MVIMRVIKTSKGFFSVIISLFAVVYLLFTMGIPQSTPNYYPEFIVKNEIHYLYLNNTVTQILSDFFESRSDCKFNIVDFNSYIKKEQGAFCKGFNTESFVCDVKVDKVAQKFNMVSVLLSVNNTYKKAGLNFSYKKDFVFSKVFDLNATTIPLPDGKEQKICTYKITDLDSDIVEVEKKLELE